MQIGMIGLGKMGGNMVRRWLRGGHSVVACDRSADAVKSVVTEGAV
ncbi:MAG TPA: NAD(P)-binding domain-containing protein, partial [Phycisphaerae bacterium]